MVLVEIGKTIVQQDRWIEVIRNIELQRADRGVHRSSSSSICLVVTVLSPLISRASSAIRIRTLERRRGVVTGDIHIASVCELCAILKFVAVRIIDNYFLYLDVKTIRSVELETWTLVADLRTCV